MKKFLCTWFGEVCYSSSLTVLPGPAWVVLCFAKKFFHLCRADFGGLNNAKLVQSVITWTAAAEEGGPADVGQLELLVGEVE